MNRMNKKGIFFTVTAVLIVVLLYAIYKTDTKVPEYYEAKSIDSRIKVMDNYVKSFEIYSGDVLELATYSALDSMYDMGVSRQSFYKDGDTFTSQFMNCTKCGYTSCRQALSPPCSNMTDRNMNYLLNNIILLASTNLNINTTYSISDVQIAQKTPYEVEVNATITYNITDEDAEYASWDNIMQISRTVSIIGLQDPYVAFSSAGGTIYQRTIIKSDVCIYNETCWNLANVTRLYDTQAYRYFVNGTSYLQRFWNDSTPSSCCGLESFMNASIVENVNASYIDYHYYAGDHSCPGIEGGPKILLYKNIDDNFKLDDAAAARYQISDLGTLVCQQ